MTYDLIPLAAFENGHQGSLRWWPSWIWSKNTTLGNPDLNSLWKLTILGSVVAHPRVFNISNVFVDLTSLTYSRWLPKNWNICYSAGNAWISTKLSEIILMVILKSTECSEGMSHDLAAILDRCTSGSTMLISFLDDECFCMQGESNNTTLYQACFIMWPTILVLETIIWWWGHWFLFGYLRYIRFANRIVFTLHVMKPSEIRIPSTIPGIPLPLYLPFPYPFPFLYSFSFL